MIKLTCLAILGNPAMHAHIPTHVHQIVSHRIERKIENDRGIDVRWNDDQCAHTAAYEYNSNKMIVRSDNQMLRGEFQAQVHDVLEGRLPQFPNNEAIVLPVTQKKEKKRRWLPWLIGGVGVAALVGGVYLLNRRNKTFVSPVGGSSNGGSSPTPASNPKKPSNGGGPQPIRF